MTARSRTKRLLIGLVPLMLLAAACGDDDDAAEEATTETATAETTAPAETAAPAQTSATTGETSAATAGETSATTGESSPSTKAPTAASEAPAEDVEYDTEATLRMATPHTPATLDPFNSRAWQIEFEWQTPIIERLLREDAEGNLQPYLATDWTFADDGSYLELTLRDDVVFQDGTPFNADVVVANINKAKEGTLTSAWLTDVTGAEAVDEYTVRLMVAPGTGAELPRVLSINAGAMVALASLDSPDIATNPIGSGPFRLVSFEPGNGGVFERWDDYWGEPAHVARLEIFGIADPQARLNALRSGQIEAAHTNVGMVADATALGEEDGFTFYSDYPFTALQHMGLNRTNEYFSNELVRQAMSYAIDRETLSEALTGGVGPAVHQLSPPSMPGFDPALEELFPYDPDRARELLEEAGYPDGFSVDGVIAYGNNVDVAQAVQGMLAEVGINITFEAVEPAQANVVYREGNSPAIIGSLASSVDVTTAWQSYLVTQDSIGAEMPAGFVDTLNETKDGTLSEDERDALFVELNTIASESPFDLYLIGYPILMTASDRVVGLDDFAYIRHGAWSAQDLGIRAD
jgi:peptide/nickel transport system substrate-binding protein